MPAKAWIDTGRKNRRGRPVYELTDVPTLQEFEAHIKAVYAYIDESIADAIDDPLDEPRPEITPKPADPELDCPGCTDIPATGLRWMSNVVKFWVNPDVPAEYYDWYLDEIDRLAEFAAVHSPLEIIVVDNEREANVTITRGPIDGQGKTLGQTTYRFSGQRMISAEIICDSSDTGLQERPTKRHEFGHSLGIPHNENSDSLMYAYASADVKDYDEYFAEELRTRHPKRFA